MTRSIPMMTFGLAVLATITIAGCAGLDTDSAAEDLSLVTCDRDGDCGRDNVCLPLYDDRGNPDGAFCSTGDRCNSSRDCVEGSVCRGGDGLHCMVLERDADGFCARGSVEGDARCPAGFEALVASRDPRCEICEPTRDTFDRCISAGFTIRQCRRLLLSLDEERIDGVTDRVRRCRAADFRPAQCRRLLAEGDDWDAIFGRCRAAELSAEECRDLFVDDEVDTDRTALYERCENAGYTRTECHRLLD